MNRFAFGLLAFAMAMFGTSVFIDKLIPNSDFAWFIEDSFKAVGIACWVGYFAHTAAGRLCALRSPAVASAL